MINTLCKNCEKIFKAYPSRIKTKGTFCCKRCWYDYKSKNGNKEKCHYCKKDFFKNPCNTGRGRDFCSVVCKAKFRKGKSLSEFVGKEKSQIWINRLSKAKKGKTHEEIFGKEEALRRKRIIKEKVHPLITGRPRLDVMERWKKARTPYDYNISSKELQKLRKHGQYKTWRKKVLLRDKVCVICQVEKNLEVDHIIPIFENRFLMLDLDNGQVLCRQCHRKKTSKELKRWLKLEASQK